MRRRILGDERGFTLPELLVTVLLMGLVMGAVYSVFDMSLHSFKTGNDRAEAISTARPGLERMEREIRMAFPYDNRIGSINRYVLLDPSDPTKKAGSLQPNQITFGNDLNGNQMLDCASTTPLSAYECITYRVSSSAPFQLLRVVPHPLTPRLDPVVDNVDGSSGLSFTYLVRDANGNLVPTSSSTNVDDIRAVLVTLKVKKGASSRTLTTIITLRNVSS